MEAMKPQPPPFPGSRPATEPWVRRAYRQTSESVLGGVAAGLAEHLAWPVLWVRLGFLALATCGGFGLALYACLWVFLPADPRRITEAPGLESARRTGKR